MNRLLLRNSLLIDFHLQFIIYSVRIDDDIPRFRNDKQIYQKCYLREKLHTKS